LRRQRAVAARSRFRDEPGIAPAAVISQKPPSMSRRLILFLAVAVKRGVVNFDAEAGLVHQRREAVFYNFGTG